ncbi:MAG TPA: glycine--tRNA ligase subunit beta [Nitrospiria bacterium]|nr:glycine--tRNA ligase subunit beta [Nitrospiria bacterium]HUK56458.1 glycine--tRNA ligase subunit beta [Nitrospiria bacterium]
MRPARQTSKRESELLLEIGTEEIPSRVLPTALIELKEKAVRMLSEARIPADRVETFATPRRLVVRATGVPTRQVTQVTEVTGPPRSAAYAADGRPTAAAIGFAKAHGVLVDGLTIKKTEKGDYVCVVQKQPSLPSTRVLKALLPDLVSSLGFPKTMRWDGQGVRFARPIRRILALLDGRIVPFHLAGLASGNRTWGHRFMANRSFPVRNWDGYCRDLKRHHVILDPAEREQLIRQELLRFAQHKKGRMAEDPDLLSQAVFLTEEPVVMLGGFDKKYLDLPSEVPITVMKEHQGYFHLLNKNGSLLPYFLFVSNVKTQKPDLIRAGNERVLRARLEDARFYFEQDKKRTLNERRAELTGLIFHEKLGTVHQKMERIKELASGLARESGRSDGEVGRIEKAALLCKSDLLTGMVREFPSLQGVVGREYARFQGEESEVAEAISEHYFPRHADDPNPPRTITGKFLTVADRLDTLVGFFGVDLAPSGSMDPYALRRQGLGLVQVLLDEAFAGISLGKAIETSAGLYADRGVSLKKSSKSIRDGLERFLSQRMETYLRRRFGQAPRDGIGFRADLADAVLCRPFDNPLDLYLRFVALTAIQRQPDFDPLIVVFKRASRILPPGFAGAVQPEALRESAEQTLHRDYLKIEKQATEFMRKRDYLQALQALSQLRRPIDAFFDAVMVMDKDPSLQKNRLALLLGITELFSRFGDFTRVMVDEGTKAK